MRSDRMPNLFQLLMGLCLLLVGVAVLANAGQQPPPLPVRPDAGLTLVRMTITGPRSKALPRLGPERVRISEDGVEQRIDYFVFDNQPPSVAVIWGIFNDTLAAEARLAPLVFLESIAMSVPPRSINERLADLSNR
jgi:hypothetical protein